MAFLAFLRFVLFSLVVYFIYHAITAAGLSIIFKKTGIDRKQAWIPVKNYINLIEKFCCDRFDKNVYIILYSVSFILGCLAYIVLANFVWRNCTTNNTQTFLDVWDPAMTYLFIRFIICVIFRLGIGAKLVYSFGKENVALIFAYIAFPRLGHLMIAGDNSKFIGVYQRQ